MTTIAEPRTTNMGDDLATILVGTSPAMQRLRTAVRMVAASDASVLICGPSGSGKEVVARAIHALSQRKSRAHVALNCGAIPRDLIESELFGHEKGAFTGALAQYKGRIEEADGGTLFLDEIGDMPADMQVRLLRVLEDRRIARVGGRGSIPVDVRVIAATHRDIDAAIDAGSFREDRLAVFPLIVPALNERLEDIPALVAHFLGKVPRARRVTFTADALTRLAAHGWPGNVRELRNVVDRAVIIYAGQAIGAAQVETILFRRGRLTMAETSAVWDATDRLAEIMPQLGAASPLAETVTHITTAAAPRPVLPEPQADPVDLGTLVADVERNFILDALSRTAGNVSEAARLLTLQRTTLIGKMQKYALAA
jgi:sigma-54 dependent transcriptional regulator, flagellar regulatory protein